MPRRTVNVQFHTNVYNTSGKTKETINLSQNVFGVKVNPELLAIASRVYLANKRAGTHEVKTRSLVAGSTRKIYRQKGTGRARHGSKKAPIFIGGGVAHGPHAKDYTLVLPKAMRRKALFMSLSDKYAHKSCTVVDGIERMQTKTKKMVEILNNLHIGNEPKKEGEKTLLILPSPLNNVILSGRNIPYLTITQARLLNAYDVIRHRHVIVTKDAVDIINDTFLGEKKEVVRDKEEIKSTKTDEAKKPSVLKKERVLKETRKKKQTRKANMRKGRKKVK